MRCTAGHSIWLIPSGPPYQILDAIIKRLSRVYGGPLFEPHITLLGESGADLPNIQAQVRFFADKMLPLKLSATAIRMEDEPYRALYLDIKMTDIIHRAFQYLSQGLNEVKKADFKPHLSLLYGRYTEEQKCGMRDELDLEFPLHFEAQTVRVVATKGLPHEWHPIKSS